MSRLTKKQRVFIEEYLRCWNASEAARRAGYRGKANVVGPRLLAKVSIREVIDQRIAELKMDADEVLTRLAEQARGIESDYFRPSRAADQVGVDFEALIADGKGHLIKSLSYNKDGLSRVEFYDAQAALAHIARALGLFVDRVEHSGPKGGPIPHDLSKLPPALLRALTDALANEVPVTGGEEGDGCPGD